ncbi:acetyl-CoA carboxylase biotin carboxyl carrier protein subunit [Aureibaculum sp. A20]|uniref:Acetyl-CoA carboxylase biotin carboxyl carrier protein subunit n=1 Tax=Aureibaculum flavum TaxID=2795986 RepID=A0ABS0WMZ9_9FLAO|nr:acetyl-CoA carboxylase biotin carboxyl carrier protein subunit [Aureibaculum flavum]MBJ2173336.1 acetyl-CoA carboxylase biotin carboxyl carrier protein subunit [Aureibaculum flavum]
MNTIYNTKVNESIEIDINANEIASLDVIEIDKDKYHVLQSNKSYEIEVITSDFVKKQYVIKVNNNKFIVDINDHLNQLIDNMGLALSSSKNVDSIKAPMPGLILDVHVKEGQEVKEDEALLVLEAMKMENVITSPHNGIIKSVNAIKGNTVEKGFLLIEFDS